MKKIIAIMAAVLVGGAAAFTIIWTVTHQGPKIKSGEIIDKTYTLASGYYNNVCFMYDKNGICTFNVPQWVDTPAQYNVRIQNCTIQHKGDDCPSSDWSIDESVWSTVVIGQQFTIK